VDYNATAASAYPNLKTLTDYLGAGSPTVVTETMANIVANTSAYFNVTGAGTVGSPFVVKPKTLLTVPHAHRLYQISLASAPAVDTYVNFQASNTERCELQITSNLYGLGTKYMINFYNIAGYVRSRNKLNAGTLTSLPMDTSSANAIVVVDVNAPEMYTSYSL
jgi:hypothetical protein